MCNACYLNLSDPLPVVVYEVVAEATDVKVQIIPQNETVDEYRIYFGNSTDPVVS